MNTDKPVAESPGRGTEWVARLLGTWSSPPRIGPTSVVHRNSGESPVSAGADLEKPSACVGMGSVSWIFPSVLQAEIKTVLPHDVVKFQEP